VFAQVANRQNAQLFVAWFFICIALTVTNTMPIGNVAHGSGALLGWLIGRAGASPSPRKTRWLALAAACSVVSLIGATVARPFVSGALDGQLHARAGYEAMERQDYAAAVEELEQAAGSRYVRAGTLINLGIAYQKLHRDSEALALYRRVIAMDPTRRPSLVEAMVSILNAQGHEDAKDGRFDDAVRAFEEAAELQPQDVYAWRMLGYVHETQGDLDTAHAYYIRASQLSPDDEDLAASVKRTAPERGAP
jgi:tetratricopeptide (TPR) repeat protein